MWVFGILKKISIIGIELDRYLEDTYVFIFGIELH